MVFTKELRKTIVLVFIIVLLVSGTRAATIQHNMQLHPDESVFYSAADSLKQALSGRAVSFEEEKEYPEGAIVLQLPFHIFSSVLRRTVGVDLSPQLTGRIASVFYFTMGILLGCVTLYSFFSKSSATIIVYGLIMIFSIIHIEQSRYGTGDAVSYFLIMMIILCSAQALSTKKNIFLLLAFFTAGTLTAVKYPLLLFTGIPVSAVVRKKTKDMIVVLLKGTLFLIIGFMLFSPKAATDPAYLIRAVSREYRMYISGGNVSEVGGIWNHLAAVVIYGVLYAGIPTAPLFYVSGVLYTVKEKKENEKYLFGFILPLFLLVFFTYNLFVTTLFFRTYYPFFCIGDLYAAFYIGEKLEQNRKKRVAIVLLMVMIMRGGYYLICLSEKNGDDRLIRLVNETVDDHLEETTLLIPGYFISFEYDAYLVARYKRLEDDYISNEDELRIKPGELIITGTEEFSRCNRYFFPIRETNSARKHANNLIANWEKFKDINKTAFVGQIYPTHYYYLFGYWIKGSTGTDYEFPTNRVYYLRTP